MNDERYYAHLKEVKVVTTTDEVNKLLLQGWEYLKSHDIQDANAVTTRIHWEMGRFVQESKPATSPPSKPKSAVTISTILDLPWQESDYQGVDRWVPADKVPAEVKEFFTKSGTKTDKGSYHVVAGNYDCYLSKSGNLQRYLAK